jgi:DNA-binding LytR/AlgR family response regulator
MQNKVRCLIIDDEQAAHFVLINYINIITHLELAGQCFNVSEAISFLHLQKVDLIFIDINMPVLSGFDFLKIFANPPAIIVTTAHAAHALESYDYEIVDYLLKPIGFPRFLKAIDRFIKSGSQQLKAIDLKSETSILLKVDRDMVTIPFSEIIYTQSLGNYVKIITSQGNYVCSITTTELEKRLPSDLFQRVHKSHIIALTKIKKFNQSTVIAGEEILPVGITYRRELGERLK